MTAILAEKKTLKIVEIAILVYLDGFSAKIWVKYNSGSILRPYLESFHKGGLFRHPQHKNVIKNLFFYLGSIFKILSREQTQKAVFLREKMTLFFIHIPWHGISSESLTTVEFDEK